MIRHIVFFSCKDQKDYDTVLNGLRSLETIPHSLHIEIGQNIKADVITQESPDFVVYGEFQDEAQLAEFKEHQTYHRCIEIVRPLRDMRIAADFLAAT